MTTPMTRRELRELERAGAISEPKVLAPIEQQVSSQMSFQGQNPELAEEHFDTIEVASPSLTRRQMREQGLLGSTAETNNPSILRSTNLKPPLLEDPASSQLLSRRSLREPPATVAEVTSVTSEEDSSGISAIEPPEEQLFTGANLFSEPSTQSIVSQS